MPYYAALNKESGELMWTQNPHALGPDWECHKVSRAPTEFDDYDKTNKRLKQDVARKAVAARSVLTPEQRIKQLEDKLADLLAQTNSRSSGNA